MRLVKVNLKEKGYDIIVGSEILHSLGYHIKRLNIGKNAIVVTNPTIEKKWGKRLAGHLRHAGLSIRFESVPDTERSKSPKTCFNLLDRIADYGRSRRVFIIAFGGGVIGDLAGFAASVYKRGIPYVQLPTTLVAQVDSAIGGKVAIDLKVGKNLIGSFYQPKLVFSETRFLRTLPIGQIREGFSEIIKYGVIKDPELFEFFETRLYALLKLEKKALEFVVRRSSQIKAKIIARDEFDRLSIRAVLNYGHTIGHAIETSAGYSKKYTHGKAVSIGMIAANFISRKLGFLSGAACERIEKLLERVSLPTRARGIRPEDIYGAHLYDKKFIGSKNRFVLPVRIGKTKIVSGIPEALVKKAIYSICENKKGR